ncbi:hypothetical protein DFA_07023 [Cavenderia fasciculata]|uniref:Uncharacterized protein n=1 Tax=Cavenderia fasciculata TaxID=261658 RepID=F4PXB3_CACFS|nr:uncharacterized protein DFA_07023 [Cavenderia fasciculata]EGG19916.1 hypothetical protein DFA_07023 [Cavenderia fasciculata]|eukprot:XP_004366899.1 hypothetical protein DFA_07023 [Cavenderia fasciculata]
MKLISNLFIIYLFVIFKVSSQTIVRFKENINCLETNGGCSWTNASNWEGGYAPDPNDIVIIDFSNNEFEGPQLISSDVDSPTFYLYQLNMTCAFGQTNGLTLALYNQDIQFTNVVSLIQGASIHFKQNTVVRFLDDLSVDGRLQADQNVSISLFNLDSTYRSTFYLGWDTSLTAAGYVNLAGNFKASGSTISFGSGIVFLSGAVVFTGGNFVANGTINIEQGSTVEVEGDFSVPVGLVSLLSGSQLLIEGSVLVDRMEIETLSTFDATADSRPIMVFNSIESAPGSSIYISEYRLINAKSCDIQGAINIFGSSAIFSQGRISDLTVTNPVSYVVLTSISLDSFSANKTYATKDLYTLFIEGSSRLGAINATNGIIQVNSASLDLYNAEIIATSISIGAGTNVSLGNTYIESNDISFSGASILLTQDSTLVGTVDISTSLLSIGTSNQLEVRGDLLFGPQSIVDIVVTAPNTNPSLSSINVQGNFEFTGTSFNIQSLSAVSRLQTINYAIQATGDISIDPTICTFKPTDSDYKSYFSLKSIQLLNYLTYTLK